MYSRIFCRISRHNKKYSPEIPGENPFLSSLSISIIQFPFVEELSYEILHLIENLALCIGLQRKDPDNTCRVTFLAEFVKKQKKIPQSGNYLKPEFRRGGLFGNPCRQLTSIFIIIWSHTHTHKCTHTYVRVS